MLTALSIRDIVLIDKLDLSLGRGLTVLTGETGAGKSILLDALGLALGARGERSLVRSGASKAVVTAAFQLEPDHRVMELIADHGVDTGDGELVVRRIQSVEGPSRAFINDQPVGVNLLRQVGAMLAEIHGQHDDRALVDANNHRSLLDAYGGLSAMVGDAASAWSRWQDARERLTASEQRIAGAEAEREFLQHAVDELRNLSPVEGEEETLAQRRQMMMHAEQFADALDEAQKALNDDGTLDARLNGALRKLERRRGEAAGMLDDVCAALERAVVEMAEARLVLDEAERRFALDPRELETAEDRLFALRALARKHKVSVDDLPGLLKRFDAELLSIDDSARMLTELKRDCDAAEVAYFDCAGKLSDKRSAAAALLDKALMAELAPLKLERAVFVTDVSADRARAGPNGTDRVEFQVSANPGNPPGPLGKVASGGELSRFMLALKVILAACGSAPTLIFDEIDTGAGGAVADAIGQRLARLAHELQVLAVTHSPQVAARAERHSLISKIAEVGADAEHTVTRIAELHADSRREEIARMLSGASVTDEARAQADRLLDRTG